MSAQANVANQYDLNLFDTSTGMDRSAYKQKIDKKIQVNTITATKTAVFMVFIAAIAAILLSQAQLTEISVQAKSLQNQLNESVQEEQRLSVQLEKETSLRKVEEYARNVLGMREILPCQIEYVSIEKPDKVEIMSAKDRESYTKKLSSAIIKSFNTVMEYLK